MARNQRLVLDGERLYGVLGQLFEKVSEKLPMSVDVSNNPNAFLSK